MKKKLFFLLLLNTSVIMAQTNLLTQSGLDHDTIMANGKTIELWFISHGSLMFRFDDFVVHVDPVAEMGDYSVMPKANLILITHQHSDHLDMDAINLIAGKDTKIFCNTLSAGKLPDATIMQNGATLKAGPLTIEAVPAYNILHERAPGKPFHPKGEGNGYVITFENRRIYIGGDTENIPEMTELKNIDVAFLPMNLPYTMTPEMVAEAASVIKPAILYPYHYGDTDAKLLIPLVNAKVTEVRIRALK